MKRSACTLTVPLVAGRHIFRVDDFAGFELAVQDSQGTPGFGMRHVNRQGLFEKLALLNGVDAQQAKIIIRLCPRLQIVGSFQGAFDVITCRVKFLYLVMENSFTQEIIIVFSRHGLFSPHNCIGHARHSQHGFHIMHPHDVSSTCDANRHTGSRSLQTLVGRQV